MKKLLLTMMMLVMTMSLTASCGQRHQAVVAVEQTDVEAGEMAPDFELPNLEGKPTKLSSLRGKYVIIDFWGAWCIWCVRGIPSMKEAYSKYKDKGLMVLGVAAWDEPEATKKAIEEDKISYPQILNSQSIGTDIYGIEGIPHIILFAPDGSILARGLRGEEIGKKLEGIFNR